MLRLILLGMRIHIIALVGKPLDGYEILSISDAPLLYGSTVWLSNN